MPGKILAVLDDLIFTVKISDAAKRAGVPVEFARGTEDALHKAPGSSAVILDLNHAPAGLIVSLKSANETRSIPLIGYVSHVRSDIIRQAKESGCNTVMARSAFVQKLAEMMADFAAPH